MAKSAAYNLPAGSRTICRDRRGEALIEVLIATGLLAFVGGVVLEALNCSLCLERTTTTSLSLRGDAERIVERLARDLRYSGTTSDGWDFPIETAVARISFSRCTGWDAGEEAPSWGPVITYEWSVDEAGGEYDDGIDNNANGIVDEGNLYRQQGTSARVLIGRQLEKSALLFWREERGDRDVATIRVGLARRDGAHPSSTIRGVYETAVTLRN